MACHERGPRSGPSRMAPRAGLEPAALRLTAARSTIELPGKSTSGQTIIGGLIRRSRGKDSLHERDRPMSIELAGKFFNDWVRPRAGTIDQDAGALREALAEMGRR